MSPKNIHAYSPEAQLAIYEAHSEKDKNRISFLEDKVRQLSKELRHARACIRKNRIDYNYPDIPRDDYSVAHFMQDMCVISRDLCVDKHHIHETYSKWVPPSRRALALNAFSRELLQCSSGEISANYRQKTGGPRLFKGIALRSAA